MSESPCRRTNSSNAARDCRRTATSSVRPGSVLVTPVPRRGRRAWLSGDGEMNKKASQRCGSAGDGLAAAPDTARLEAVIPAEGALVVGVPEHDVGQPATDHRAAVRRAQRVRAAEG